MLQGAQDNLFTSCISIHCNICPPYVSVIVEPSVLPLNIAGYASLTHTTFQIGVDFALKVLNWDNNTTIRLQLWDIAGKYSSRLSGRKGTEIIEDSG